jgi:hypothetical protein
MGDVPLFAVLELILSLLGKVVARFLYLTQWQVVSVVLAEDGLRYPDGILFVPLLA